MNYTDYFRFLCSHQLRDGRAVPSSVNSIAGLPREDFWDRLEPALEPDHESMILKTIDNVRKHLESIGTIDQHYLTGDFGVFKNGDTFGCVLDKLADVVRDHFSRRATT